MVDSKQHFLIDATFIFEKTQKSFLAAPLFVSKGHDNTFLYGFMRDFLRLRQVIGINNGVIAVSKEAHAVTEETNIQEAFDLINRIRIPCIYNADISILAICADLSSQISYIITQDKKLLHLASTNLSIIFPNDFKQIESMTPSNIKSKIGVDPENIPSFLSLTKSPKTSGLTKLQAIRLIELYQNVDRIYENLPSITAAIRKKLSLNEDLIRSNYSDMGISEIAHKVYNIDNFSLNLENEDNIDLLKSYGLFSLTRLLQSPVKIHLDVKTVLKTSDSYHAVVNQKSLKELEAVLSSSEWCALDTESDDKDPQYASLLGVSFSVKAGQAFFIPLMAKDLKNLTTDDVLSFLKKVVSKPIKFIGHNIKYDYLLLLKHGIKIQNIYFDTMLAAFECYGDLTFFNLKYLAHKLLGKTIKSYKEIVSKEKTFLDLPLKKMVQHACEDADITRQLFTVLYNELKEKGIWEQYFSDTLPMVEYLGDMEFNGISIRIEELEKIRQGILNLSLDLKHRIYENVGKEFDLDSSKELEVIIKNDLGLQEFIGSRKITLPALEQLGKSNDPIRLMVHYKRYLKQIKRIDSILKAAKDNKIYPIFSQIKSAYGQISSIRPNLFENVGNDEAFKKCFDKTISPFFRDKQNSFEILEKLTHDQSLKMDRVNGMNKFLDAHPKYQAIDNEDFMLCLIIGYSDAKVSKEFMLDRLILSTMRHDLEMRYPVLFEWIEGFKRETIKQGFAMINKKRKCLDGLRSSNIEKRNNAINLSIRWLITKTCVSGLHS